MANIVERITGALSLPDIEAGEEKINLNAFIAALNEFARGKVPSAEVIAAFNLTPAQTTQTQTLVALANAAPDRSLFLRVFRDLMYLGEPGEYHARYRDITYIQTRLEEEVTDQGGTLP